MRPARGDGGRLARGRTSRGRLQLHHAARARRLGDELRRYAIDPVTGPSLLEAYDVLGSTCSFAVSPNGEHIAAGWLNRVYEHEAGSLATLSGSFTSGSYARATAYDLSGSRLVAGTSFELLVYDAATRALEFQAAAPGCRSVYDRWAGFWRGGGLAYLGEQCDSYGTNVRIRWLSFGSR